MIGGRGSIFGEHSALQPTTELTMINSTTRIFALFLALGAAACGAASSSGSTADEVGQRDEGGAWTRAQLERLDSDLRSRVAEAEGERFAIKVYFYDDLPSDEELGELLLSRVGEQVIGNVEVDTLRVIASRTDVERIEAINDVGYDTL
jgi:hypothetical protein